MYVYVGLIGKRYEHIFKRIENLNLHDTLLEITLAEEKELNNGFGDFWMTKFFNIYHITSFVLSLEQQNSNAKAELFKKYDNRWLQNFINKFKTELIFKKIYYSYSDLIKFQYKVKMGKKLEKIEIDTDETEDLNFKTETHKTKNILYNIKELSKQLGGNNNINKLSNQLGGNDDEHDGLPEILDNTEIDDADIFDPLEDQEPTIIEDIDIDEMEKIYQKDEVDTHLTATSTMLSNILHDDKIIENKSNYITKFDTSQDNDLENQTIENVYKKKFIYNQYIYKDDTIKSIKTKITCSIANNEKFGSQPYIIPSRMYLWSEYIINSKIEKIMIGQKWMNRNELLSIDIEPLKLSHYENLETSIKNFRDSAKRYGGKIRREDEDNNILHDYQNYILNDEIYMIDIYNELGLDYLINKEKITNLTDTYIKIYFPKIRPEDIKGIFDYLNNNHNDNDNDNDNDSNNHHNHHDISTSTSTNAKSENTKIKNTFETLYNDLLIENEITDLVQTTMIDESDTYTKLFEPGNFITQSVIHVNLEIHDEQLEKVNKQNINKVNKATGEFGSIILPRLDLFRIFNDFVPDDKYPFVQYQLPDGQLIIKYYEDYMYEFSKTKDNIEMITKWFENSPYGISFKVKSTEDKFTSININDIGKIEYKTHWKQEDNANIHDVISIYSYVKDLVIKINETLIDHPRTVYIKVPEDWEFRFAFINCIQKFILPENKTIDHNDLSDFSSFFFPYAALVIEPRKRTSKSSLTEKKSKYGSYLRYKRISGYENEGKIEQRILLYLKRYDFEEDILIDEISKQFNITPEKAKDEISKVKSQFTASATDKSKKLKLSKKTDTPPKIKPLGINIDIQGKIPDKYKIRISGARTQQQLERIITFLNVLIYLYSETYILKKPHRQHLKEKLSKLVNIAKRRNKVDDYVDYKTELNVVKQMAQLDKKRLGFTPDEGQNQWTRSCQNSGNDKKRRPLQTLSTHTSELLKKGYTYNKKTDEYERKILFKRKGKGKRKGETILKAIKVTDQDEANVTNDIYYTCDPEDNGEHTFIGFLTRSNNPFGECMPCCFKNSQLTSKKKEKTEFYKRCMGEKPTTTQSTSPEEIQIPKNTSLIAGDILYILQDTNKMHENRISYLPKFIDYFINVQFKKQADIKNHYLLKTTSYYFKYGIKQENYSFLNTLESILNTPISEIKNIITEFLKKDTDELHYYSLNDGDIRTEYLINDFIRFINDTEHLDYNYLKDLIKIPGLFTKNGIYPIVFQKITKITKKHNDREKITEDFYIDIDKNTILDHEYNLAQMDTHDILILIKDNKFYYPIVEIIKPELGSKNLKITKLFNNTDSNDIIQQLKKYFTKTIQDAQIDIISDNISARKAYSIIQPIASKNPNYTIIHQVVDSRFKCKYLITKNKTIIPITPSGIIDDVPILCFNTNTAGDKLRGDCFSKFPFTNISTTNDNLEQLYKLSSKKLNIKPIGLFYDSITQTELVNIVGIITSNNDLVPIQKIQIPKSELDSQNTLYQNRPLYHELDQKLSNYTKDNFEFIDERIKNVNTSKYKNESYQLFRYELANLINSKEYSNTKNMLMNYIKSKDTAQIQDLILTISTNKLDNKITSKNTVGSELVKIIQDIPNIDYYKINNQRKICSKHDDNTCQANPHCTLHDGKCSFSLTQEYLLEFIQKISTELTEQEIKVFELLKLDKYFVSDIVDYNNFTEKPNQKIIKSTNANLSKILTDLFGKEHVPKIGRRYIAKLKSDLLILQSENPLKDIKDAYQQTLMPYNYSILRAYCNGYYWIKHKFYTNDTRNLGYYSDLQNEIVNVFRSIIIDWLNIPDNITELISLKPHEKAIIKNSILYLQPQQKTQKQIINNYIIKLMEKPTEQNLGLFELFILNKIHNIPITILINGTPKYFIDYEHIIEINDDSKYLTKHNICVNLELHSDISYPYSVDVIYYK